MARLTDEITETEAQMDTTLLLILAKKGIVVPYCAFVITPTTAGLQYF